MLCPALQKWVGVTLEDRWTVNKCDEKPGVLLHLQLAENKDELVRYTGLLLSTQSCLATLAHPARATVDRIGYRRNRHFQSVTAITIRREQLAEGVSCYRWLRGKRLVSSAFPRSEAGEEGIADLCPPSLSVVIDDSQGVAGSAFHAAHAMLQIRPIKSATSFDRAVPGRKDQKLSLHR